MVSPMKPVHIKISTLEKTLALCLGANCIRYCVLGAKRNKINKHKVDLYIINIYHLDITRIIVKGVFEDWRTKSHCLEALADTYRNMVVLKVVCMYNIIHVAIYMYATINKPWGQNSYSEDPWQRRGMCRALFLCKQLTAFRSVSASKHF